jgi:hypothetical protein
MKAVYVKHRSEALFIRITLHKAELFKTGHVFGFCHESCEDPQVIKGWLFEALSEGLYRLSNAAEFDNARRQFVNHALGLEQEDKATVRQVEAKEVYFHLIAEEECA